MKNMFLIAIYALLFQFYFASGNFLHNSIHEEDHFNKAELFTRIGQYESLQQNQLKYMTLPNRSKYSEVGQYHYRCPDSRNCRNLNFTNRKIVADKIGKMHRRLSPKLEATATSHFTEMALAKRSNSQFKPTTPTHLQLRRQSEMTSTSTTTPKPEQCDGYNNVINDVGIVSLTLGILGAALGIISYFPAIFTFLLSLSSIVVTGFPSSAVFIAQLFSSATFLNAASTATSILGVIDLLLNVLINIPISNLGNVISLVADALSVISLIVGVLPFFADEFKKSLTDFGYLGIVDGYGCNNPFSLDLEF